MSRTPIEEKIALLLKKAEQVGAAEAEAFTEMAEKLMLKHGIEQAAIDAARLGTDRTAETIVQRIIEVDGIYVKALFQGIADVCAGLGELRVVGSGQKVMHIRIIGYERDTDQAVTLIQSLQIQAAVAMRTWWATTGKPKGSVGYNMRRSYIAGFFSGAGTRIARNKLAVIKEVDNEQGGSSALVLVDRAKSVEAYMGEQFGGRLKMSRGMKTEHNSRYDGVRDGLNANTGDKGVTGSRNQIGG